MLSHDNITSLIGQNESGKTSILEGIRAFYDGNLIEDMLRSDLSLPEVSCKFSFSISDFEDDIDTKKLDPKIRKEISKIQEISLMRIWDEDLDSHLVMGDELQEIFNEPFESSKQRTVKLTKSIEGISEEVKKVSSALEKLQTELSDTEAKIEVLNQRIAEIKRSGRPFSTKDKKKQLNEELDKEGDALDKLLGTKKTRLSSLKEKQKVYNKLEQKVLARDRLHEAEEKIRDKKNDIIKSNENLKQIHQIAEIYSTEKEQRAAELKEVIYRNEIAGHKGILRSSTGNTIYCLWLLRRCLTGKILIVL